MEIDTRITDIYIHAYIYIFENHRHLPISILLFNSKGERVFEEVFLNILSLFFFSNLFSSLRREEEGREEVTLLQKSPVRGKCEYDVSYPFYSACKYTRGKRIRGVGPRTYFTHHGRSASVPAKGGFILSRFTMLYGVGLAASTNNCQLNVPSIDLVPRISFLSC